MISARNPRRAYDHDGAEIDPMTLGNMRSLGTTEILASCEKCSRDAVVDVSALPDEVPVPDVALRLRCSACDSRSVKTIPRWRVT